MLFFFTDSHRREGGLIFICYHQNCLFTNTEMLRRKRDAKCMHQSQSNRLVFSRFLDFRGNLRNGKEKPTRKTCFSYKMNAWLYASAWQNFARRHFFDAKEVSIVVLWQRISFFLKKKNMLFCSLGIYISLHFLPILLKN